MIFIEIRNYYFGQSQDVEKRWECNGIHYKDTSLQPYIEKFGWDNIQHIVLFRDKTKEDALWIEDFLITTAREDGVCINKHRSGLVSKEEGYDQQYYQQNKDKIKQYREQNKDKKKQYYEQNKEQIKEQKKQYYEQNKDKILEQNKQYYEQNKEQIREQKREYREQNKDKIKQYYEQNKDKKRNYDRQRYQRKKQEKQFEELGYIPLF